MTAVFGLPFPWDDPVAQELHRLLYLLFPTPQQAVLIASKAGIDTGMIYQQQAIVILWKDILDAAATAAATKKLVSVAAKHLSDHHPNKQFFADLLEDRRVTLTSDQSASGPDTFLGASDSVSEPEALLYYDDLTISTGQIPALIKTLAKLAEVSSAVCKLTIGFPGMQSSGTGFRIGTNHLLTNWHVLHHPYTGVRANSVSAEFEYEQNVDGTLRAGKPILCDVTSVVGNQSDDWAVIRTLESLDDEWRIIPLLPTTPVEGQSAYIVQHPGGTRKRLGFIRNQISLVTPRFVYYLTDTQPGSSGSPVFDAEGNLIALHRAGGTPQTAVGKPPVKKNEGVNITQIVSGLQDAGIKLN
jgi:Trypsin-like peptidase domain